MSAKTVRAMYVVLPSYEEAVMSRLCFVSLKTLNFYSIIRPTMQENN